MDTDGSTFSGSRGRLLARHHAGVAEVYRMYRTTLAYDMHCKDVVANVVRVQLGQW